MVVAAPQIKAQDLSQYPEPRLAHVWRASLFNVLPINKKDIVMLGNSITHHGLWSELFDSKRVKNRGIAGDKTYDVLRRLDPIVKGQPKKVFILVGINDIALTNIGSPDQVYARYRQIVERFVKESPRTKVYVQSVMPMNETVKNAARHTAKRKEVNELNAKLKAMSQELGVTYIDLFPALADSDGRMRPEYTWDGLHLWGEGYLAWRDALKPYMK